MKPYGTILVVDDNSDILIALRYCLESYFERILTLEQPDAIAKILAQEQVDVVLLDMNFKVGEVSGQEGLYWLRSIRKRHPQIPVVLLTAYADIPLAVAGLKSGAADFITKPWTNEVLIQKLKDVLEMKSEIVSLDVLERAHIQSAIDRCHGNLSLAAELLGITRQTLYNKLKRLS